MRLPLMATHVDRPFGMMIKRSSRTTSESAVTSKQGQYSDLRQVLAAPAAGAPPPARGDRAEADALTDWSLTKDHSTAREIDILTGDDSDPQVPRDTVGLRRQAKIWLTAHITAGNHRDREDTLRTMRAAHPGLSVRGSFALWGEVAKENPQLGLSRRGRKLKRNANN